MTRYFYCADGVTVVGPIERTAMQAMLDGGAITLETPVRVEEQQTWGVAGNYFDLRPPPIPAAPRQIPGVVEVKANTGKSLVILGTLLCIGGIILATILVATETPAAAGFVGVIAVLGFFLAIVGRIME